MNYMMAGRVSVIIAVYNDPDRLVRCVDSLFNQTVGIEKVEIIIVDNGSEIPVAVPSGCGNLVKLLWEPTPGSYAARNTGAKVATGDILAFTDADCMPRGDWLEKGVGCLEAMQPKGIVGGAVRMFLPDDAARKSPALYDLCLGLRQESYWREEGFFITANLFTTASVFRQIGPFRNDLFSGGDREWCRRAAARGIEFDFARNAVVNHPVRVSWSGLRRKVLRLAGGGMDARARSSGNPDFSVGSRVARKLAVAASVLRDPRLRNWRERAKVFMVAAVVLAWKLEARARRSLGLPNFR